MSKRPQKALAKRPTLARLETPGGPLTSAAQALFKHPAFEKVTLIVTCLNGAWIGFDIDWNDGEASSVSPVIFVIGENLFCCLFTLELLTRFFTFNRKMSFFTDSHSGKNNVFDLFVTTLMILEVWVLGPLATNSNLNSFSVLRMLRLLRLLGLSRIFRVVPELAIMVKNMALALRTVSSTLVLEIGLIYVFAIVFTYWAKHHPDPCSVDFGDQNCLLNELFGSIMKSFVTLMQILVVDNTFVIIRPVLNDAWYMGGLLILFMVLATWTVLNMLIGIICEIVNEGTSDEKMRMLEQCVREVFASMDEDGSGSVTRDEFNGAAMKQLEKLGISKDVMQNAFSIIDEDGSGAFEVDEFLHMIFKLLNPPQSQDIQVLSSKLSQIQSHLSIQNPKGALGRSGSILGRSGSILGRSGSMVIANTDSERAGSSRQDSSRQDCNESLPDSPKLASVPETLDAKGFDHSPVATVPETLNAKGFDESPAALPEFHDAHKSSHQLQPLPKVSELAMAQDIFEKLQQIAQNTAKVEHALRLVHGWKARGPHSPGDTGQALETTDPLLEFLVVPDLDDNTASPLINPRPVTR